MYFEAIRQMKKMLGQLDKWLEAAGTFAQTKNFDSKVIVGLRLAPDQFAFARQVQSCCDSAKFAAFRLAGKDAPKQEDNEQTLDDLRARVRATIGFLDGFTAQDFADAASRRIAQPRWEGRWMTGPDYFFEHAQPNFFFHLNHAYAILRHNGVNIGKRDYLGALTQHNP